MVVLTFMHSYLKNLHGIIITSHLFVHNLTEAFSSADETHFAFASRAVTAIMTLA